MSTSRSPGHQDLPGAGGLKRFAIVSERRRRDGAPFVARDPGTPFIMIRFIPLTPVVLGLALLAFGAPARAADSDVVAKVGKESITVGDLNLAAADLGEQFGKLPPEQRRLAVLSAVIDIKSLAQQAEKARIQDDPAVKTRIAFLRERALHNAYFQKQAVSAIKDDELKQRYDREVAKLKPVEELHARHILVKTREEADGVIRDLKAGGDFLALAKAHSSGPSGPEGGDLGFFGPGQMVPAFEKAAYALDVGKYTETPVETQFGWHVIQVLEKRAQPQPAFDQVKDQIRQVVMREKYMALVQKARDQLKVVYSDPALKTQVDALEKAMSNGAAPGGDQPGAPAP